MEFIFIISPTFERRFLIGLNLMKAAGITKWSHFH